MIKRTFDLIVSSLLILLSSPVLLLAALLIRRDSGGPALFRQQRVGLDGRPFEMLKFRSMVVDAERRGGYATQTDDPRITKLGRVLRRTSIDELPQLFNVLRGEMSLVGPRPNVPEQKAEYSEEQWRLRHRVRPGITGLAQARLRSRATWEQRLALDLEYCDRAGFFYDLWILGLTVRQLFIRGGN
ncbi:sugar transferase [Dongshaea marina]|uniref:sugar transferase n=1 Tax=Dongshaea marina TaxID=2047966 RepID=UPI000D3E44FC|nr:sugar transferase [Dongshaea marina]